MSSDGTRIESVYEPGFGETGPQKSEDLVMVENPISVYAIKDERSERYQKAINNIGLFDYKSKDMILLAESGDAKQQQGVIALRSAIKELISEQNYPRVMTRKDFDGGYSTSEVSPIEVVTFTDEFTHTNSESGIKIPATNIVFVKRNEASDIEYTRGRTMIINKANEALQLFNTDFRIPQFPSDDKLKKI